MTGGARAAHVSTAVITRAQTDTTLVSVDAPPTRLHNSRRHMTYLRLYHVTPR